MDNGPFQRLWNEDDYCANLGISPSKARQDRVKGIGPKFIKVGRSVRYRPSDVDDWLNTQLRENTIMPQPQVFQKES